VTWTWQAVGVVLTGAFEALLAQPLGPRDIPADLRAGWPDVLHDAREAYGYDPARRRPLRPNARQLEQACRVVGWILWVERERDRRVVAGRLCGLTWRRLAEFDGRSQEHLRQKVWPRALAGIAARLDAEQNISPDLLTEIGRFRRFPR
jgi:hypothetical protein